jgi:hypothetical protein
MFVVSYDSAGVTDARATLETQNVAEDLQLKGDLDQLSGDFRPRVVQITYGEGGPLL